MQTQDHQQIARFLANAPEPADLDPMAPRAVFTTALEISRDNEDALVYYLTEFIDKMKKESGRDLAHHNAWYSGTPGEAKGISKNWMARRQLHDMTYAGEMAWRETVLGNIFSEHNQTVPLSRRIVQQQHSRANDYFFSTDPWFAVTPVGDEDQVTAKTINRYARWAFDKHQIKDSLRLAVKNAFIRGEQVLKPTWVHRTTRYESWEDIAVFPGGEAIIANDGDYIYEADTWVDNVGGVNMMADNPDAPGDPEQAIPVQVLERDPSTTIPVGMVPDYERRKIWREIDLKKGVEMDLVYYKDFLCPLTAETTDDAEVCAHLYDQHAFDIVTRYMAGIEENEDGTPNEEFPKVLEFVNAMATESGAAKTAKNQPRPEEEGSGSFGVSGDGLNDEEISIEPRIEIAECYLRYDVHGNGGSPEIMVLMDMTNERPILYDYTPNVTPDGKRPFHVVRINPVDGKWYGSGEMETFSELQMMADLLQNRWNESQSNSGWIDIVRPDLIQNLDANNNIEINGGRTYTVKPSADPKEVIFRLPLYDNRSDKIIEELQWYFQLAMNMSGVMNTNDGKMAGQQSTELATGIRNIERAGQEMFGPKLSDLETGLTTAVRAALKLNVQHMNDKEAYRYFDTKKQDEAEAVIMKDDIANLFFDVSLELTRYKGEQELEQSLRAEETANRFYDLPFQRQERLAPLYRTQLKLMQIPHADAVIEPMMSMEEQMGMGAPGGTQMPPPAGDVKTAAAPPPSKPEPAL